MLSPTRTGRYTITLSGYNFKVAKLVKMILILITTVPTHLAHFVSLLIVVIKRTYIEIMNVFRLTSSVMSLWGGGGGRVKTNKTNSLKVR